MNTEQNHESSDHHTGSSFDDFLEEEGIRNEVEAVAIRRVSDWQAKSSRLKAKRQRRASSQPRPKA